MVFNVLEHFCWFEKVEPTTQEKVCKKLLGDTKSGLLKWKYTPSDNPAFESDGNHHIKILRCIDTCTTFRGRTCKSIRYDVYIDHFICIEESISGVCYPMLDSLWKSLEIQCYGEILDCPHKTIIQMKDAAMKSFLNS